MENQQIVGEFFSGRADRPTLGLVYGRRRIGKSTLLAGEAARGGGFYFEATRVETRLQLERLGTALGEHLGVGRIALDSWDTAIEALLRLGNERPIPVVLDEFGHVLEADASVDSVLAAAFGPGARRTRGGQARFVLCGSAVAMMRALTAGEAPLRGRAGMELVMHADDFRRAASRLRDPTDLDTAVRVFAVIGGVVGYATDMVDFDLPDGFDDVDRWIVRRVLSPGATLRNEATTLLAEDPTLSGRGSLLHHSILGAIANGAVTAGTIANRLGKRVSNLAPALNRLVDAGFVSRVEDPLRDQRPLYTLDDPFLQFHYAILEPHAATLRDRDPMTAWTNRLVATFDSQVRGPVFESQARLWARRFADVATLGGDGPIGPSHVAIDGVEHELDVVVAAPGPVPAERSIAAIGEAKAGERLTLSHLNRLERARAAFGTRAVGAKLLLFGTRVDRPLRDVAANRSDVEIVDLERLYRGT